MLPWLSLPLVRRKGARPRGAQWSYTSSKTGDMEWSRQVTPPFRDQRSEHETEDFCSTSSSLFGGLSTSKIRHLVTDAYQPAEFEGHPMVPPNFSNFTGSAASEAGARGGRARPRGRAAAPRRAAGNGEGGGAEKAGGTRKAPALGGRTSGEGGTMMVGDQGGINILWKGF